MSLAVLVTPILMSLVDDSSAFVNSSTGFSNTVAAFVPTLVTYTGVSVVLNPVPVNKLYVII